MDFIGIGESSCLALFLQLGNRSLGALLLLTEGNGRYNHEHADLFSLLLEPFSFAMYNTQMYLEISRLRDALADDNRFLRSELQRLGGSVIVGEEFGLKEVMSMVSQVASHDSPVLLLGETGTGKDLVASAIHQASARNEGPFIIVNCGAIPETLLDSELFGHEKGAFTGALSQKRGRFERADKGTIFLDEIGEMPLQAQIRLLRVLQNLEIERVGGTETIPVDIRVIAATNVNLEEMVERKEFREDLWFRLNVFPVSIPPLRERKEDILALTQYFVERKSQELKLKRVPILADRAIELLEEYSWPGNVRELENVVERALILTKGGLLEFDRLVESHQPKGMAEAGITLSSREEESFILDDVLRNHIERVLGLCGSKIHGSGGAAELMGINPNTLRNRMDKLGISYGRNK